VRYEREDAMRFGSPAGPRALGFSLAAVVATSLVASQAGAADDPVVQCIAASDKGLDLRKQGKLIEARRVLATCAATTCGQAIASVCEKRLAEINGTLPSIVFLPKDAAGNDVAGVRMSVDGAPAVETLAGRPVTLDPGPHAFKFEVAGQPSVERSFVLVEGTKDRQERIDVGPPVATPAHPNADGAATSPPAAGGTGNGQRVVGVVLGVTGIVALGVGGAIGLSAKSSYDGAPGCNGSVCQSQQGLNTRNSAIGTGNVATAVSIAGAAVAVGGGIVWLTAPRASKTEGAGTPRDWRLGVAPGTLVLGGSF
jgi:hypothetical protein